MGLKLSLINDPDFSFLILLLISMWLDTVDCTHVQLCSRQKGRQEEGDYNLHESKWGKTQT